MGKPVVANALEGNLEIIEHKKTGLLVQSRNQEDMAQNINYLISQPKEAKKIGHAARERILENFSLQHMIQRYKDFYLGMLNNKGECMNKKKIAYIVSLYPCWSETFILNEIIELTKKDYDVSIFSIRSDLEEYTQEKAKPYLPKTKYVEVPKMFLCFFKYLFTRPQIVIPWTIKIKLKSLKNPKIFLKNVWCIFVACYFADIVKKEQIEHLHAHFGDLSSACFFDDFKIG